MKKNLNTLIIGNKIAILQELYKKTKNANFILINDNIIELEKEKQSNKNITIYPMYTDMINDIEQKILDIIIKQKFKNIHSIIIYTPQPQSAEPLENTNIQDWITIFNKNINFTINIIKNYIKCSNLAITFILHREKKANNIFFTKNQYINNFFIKNMNVMHKNNKNIIINCISTENIKLTYKNIIYPYKQNKSLKTLKNIPKAYIYTIKKNINKKILIL